MSQPARRMNAALPATLFLMASGGLHVLLLLGLARSASGAEGAWDESEPARFVGNTFEIETVEALPPTAGSPAPEPASAPEPDPASASAVPPLAAPAPIAPPTSPEPAEAPVAQEPVLPSAPVGAAATASAASAAPSAGAAEATLEAGATPEAGAAPEARAARAAASSGAVVYGQDALPASTASFAKAFTRAVPRIASADKVWHGLPLGSAGSVVFDIEVDAGGKVVGQGTILDKPVPAAHLARIIGRTVLLLRNQSFGPPREGEAPIRQRLELSAEIRQVAALDDTFAEPQDLRQIGRLVEPTRVRPGKANFTYNSGRQVELTVRLLNP